MSVRDGMKPLVRWVLYVDGWPGRWNIAGTLLTNGYDEQGAKLIASKLHHVSTASVRVWPYEECPRAHRHAAAVADGENARRLMPDALRPRETDDGDLRTRDRPGMLPLV